MNLHALPKIVDPIILDLLKIQDAKTQVYLDNAVAARGMLTEAVNLLHKLGIHDSGDGCDFDERICSGDANPTPEPQCENYERCKNEHERFQLLLGAWEITNPVQDGMRMIEGFRRETERIALEQAKKREETGDDVPGYTR